MNLNKRRYSDWLLAAELRLTRRRDRVQRACVICAVGVAVIEAALPWERLTPVIPWWAHIAAAAIALPVLWLATQNDYRAKQQAFASAMNDLGRRLLFLDSIWESEHTEVQERYEASVLRPTQRALDQLRDGAPQHKSLRQRLEWFYRALPTSVHEADRLGPLSILHPRVALGWLAAIGLTWACLPVLGLHLVAPSGLPLLSGITLLPLLLPVYLVYAHHSTRFAFELALYDWLRLG